VADEGYLEVYRQLRAGQDKYVYFVLAAAASAVAFALSRAESRPLSQSLIPWGLALLFWGVSFSFGCIHLMLMNSILYGNSVLLEVESGIDPQIGNPPLGTSPQLFQIASKGIRTAIKRNTSKASTFGQLQTWFFAAGGIAYIGWQVLEMYLRTP
jgi:hypothetical protein